MYRMGRVYVSLFKLDVAGLPVIWINGPLNLDTSHSNDVMKWRGVLEHPKHRSERDRNPKIGNCSHPHTVYIPHKMYPPLCQP